MIGIINLIYTVNAQLILQVSCLKYCKIIVLTLRKKQFRQCNGSNIYTNEEPSFFKTVKWDDFMGNHNYYIEKAIEIKNNKDAYDVHINLD